MLELLVANNKIKESIGLDNIDSKEFIEIISKVLDMIIIDN